MMVFEHRRERLLTRTQFLKRVLRSGAAAFLVIAASLGIGILGYHHYERLNWIDAFANAAMILSGMGPLNQLQSDSGKIFAGLYALFSGIAFIAAMGIISAPILHRLLHRFHLEG